MKRDYAIIDANIKKMHDIRARKLKLLPAMQDRLDQLETEKRAVQHQRALERRKKNNEKIVT